jgi:NSS family neurotransmitter:Na+ symporter
MAAAKERWSGRLGFVLASIGSAVGLGSIWKFPYEVGSNGGSAFVFFYLAGLVLVVVPLVFAEFAIGRRGGGDAATSIAVVATAQGASIRWMWVGALGIAVGVLILSFYSVIGGWTIAYAVETAREGLAGTAPGAVQARFDDLLASPWRMTGYHALFMGIAAAIVARGIGSGIETACKVLMPALVALLVGLAAYSVAGGGLAATLDFLFHLDLEDVSARAALEALGLGFFSIGVGMALMITYAAYAGESIDLRRAAIATVTADTAISFLAGFAVFPLVFANALDPASGPGLVFVTLPLAFARMPLGALAAVAFFVLLVFAALASAISLLEVAAALLTHRIGWPRSRATVVPAVGCFIGGIATVLSFNLWAEWHPLAFVPGLAQATVFDLVDHLTSNVMLPISGLAIAVLAGWALPKAFLAEELRMKPGRAAGLRWVLRWVAPAGILVAALAPLLA